MASGAPDPQGLQSWEEAFQHPIPTVRRVEQELRRDIASNKEKLRGLVGTRYRELLGTAETIVQMNSEIEDVVSNLTSVGRNCNSRVMETKAEHVSQLRREKSSIGLEIQAFAAQLALLQRCTSTVSRLLRRRSSNLLAAKLLVISRHLHKALSQNENAPPFLESLRSQLVSLRRKLLKRIDRRLASAALTADEIVEAMSAYCLATSSSSNDAIRHFHNVRVEAIDFQLVQSSPGHENVVKALQVYIKTLQNTKTIFSRRLTDPLGRLTARPLLKDPDVYDLDELDMDILGRWVANDIKNFTPWIKHSEVAKQEAETLVKKWSKEAFDNFLKGFRTILEECKDVKDLLILRKEILNTWLPVQSSTPVHSPLGVLDGIRNTVNNQLVLILRTQAKDLAAIGQDALSVITNWDSDSHHKASTLWDPALTSLDLSDGAAKFKDQILARTLGEDDRLSQLVSMYNFWLASVQASRNMTEDLSRTKWEEFLDDDDDDEDPMDFVAMLNEDDPHLLRKEYSEALTKAFANLQSSLQSTVQSMSETNHGHQAAFILRLIREIRRKLPNDFLDSHDVFAQDIVPQLHQILASAVVSNTAPFSLARCAGGRLPGRTLWEGKPPLPAQPSPETFKLMRRLALAMEGHGPDLWNAQALDILKLRLHREISTSTTSEIENQARSEAENCEASQATQVSSPDEDTESSDVVERAKIATSSENKADSDAPRELKIQILFDLFYLSEGLKLKFKTEEESTGNLEITMNGLKEDLDLGQEVLTRMEKGAEEYWKRTVILFGLLS